MFFIKRLQRHDLRIVALLCALCFLSAVTAAPTHAQNLPGRDMAPVVGALPTAISSEQLRGAPLFWATDITATEDLPAYKSVGFNTVVVRLSWKPNAPNNLAALDVEPQRQFAQAAAKAGLKVIYSLPPAPQGMEFQIRIAGDSPSYNLLWSSWVNAAIANLRDTPNLVGWMLPDDPRSLPMWSDESFRRWIGRNYATRDVLNQQWGTNYRDLADVTQNDVEALVERNQGAATAQGSYALGGLGTANNPTIRNPAFHPAALALAAYRWEAYRELLVTWIGVVRGADSSHLLFSGAMPDYAQMLSMPAGVDVMMPAITPGVAENDVVTHNPQSIDIARRGGKFAALPIFSVGGNATLSREDLPDLSKRWLQEACARGASGVGLNSWPELKNNLDLRQSVLEKWRALNSAPNRALWGEPPVATTAVVLTPLADGATLGFGPIELGGKRGLYGWAENLSAGEPSNLVWALRWGTAFGSVDYLAPNDLDGPLEIYNTILAPQMLSCSLQNQTALTNYVTGGGVLVADLGLGALQSGGQVGSLPPAMSLLFGVPGTYDVRPLSFNLQGASPHELLPKWSDLVRRRSKIVLTNGDAPGGDAFAGPVGFSIVNPVATIIGAGPQIGTRTAGDFPAILSAPLTANNAGRGAAIFAPFRLWDYWRPGHLGFNSFHGDLMALGATLAVSRNESGPISDVTPDPVNTPFGITRFPEIINRPRDVTFIDHDDPSQPLKLSSVETTGVGDWLWSGGIALLPNSQSVSLTGGRPAPIENASPLESRMRPLGLFVSIGQGEMLNLRMEPISAQNLGGGPLCGQVVSNTRAGAEIYLWPNAIQIEPAFSSIQGAISPNVPDNAIQVAPRQIPTAWQPVPTIPGKVRLTVYSSPDALSWAPGTRVRANITSYSVVKNKKGDKFNTDNKEIFAVVDARGRATWEFETATARIQIAGAA